MAVRGSIILTCIYRWRDAKADFGEESGDLSPSHPASPNTNDDTHAPTPTRLAAHPHPCPLPIPVHGGKGARPWKTLLPIQPRVTGTQETGTAGVTTSVPGLCEEGWQAAGNVDRVRPRLSPRPPSPVLFLRSLPMSSFVN